MEEIKRPALLIRFGIFELDLQAGELRRQGLKVKLQEQPLQVLVILLERAGEVVTREELQKQIWPADTFVDFERGLNRAINKIREALFDSAESPRFVETLPRRGYRFIAEVAALPRLEVAEKASPPVDPPAAQPPDMLNSGHEAPVGQVVHSQTGSLTDNRKKWAILAAAAVLLTAGVWWAAPRTPQMSSAVIVLMDTTAPMGIYDEATRKNSGSNADDISDILRDLPVALHKESVGAKWDREDQVLKQTPDLIIIHLSAFFHAMNLDFQVGYPPFNDSGRQELFFHLLNAGNNRLETFMGYAGAANPKIKFLVYSRGRPGEWSDASNRRDWAQTAERRFPALKGKVFTLNVEGGMNGRIRDPGTVVQLRRSVQSILNLRPSELTQ